MEFGAMFSGVWKKAALIGVVWGAISGIINLAVAYMVKGSGIGAGGVNPANAVGTVAVVGIAALIMLALGLIIPILTGYLSTKKYAAGKEIDLGTGAVAGLFAGIVFGIILAIVGVVVAILQSVLGLTVSTGPGAAVNGVIGIIGAAVGGLILTLPIGAVLALVGGALYSIIKK